VYKEIEYRILSAFGGGKWSHCNDIYGVLHHTLGRLMTVPIFVKTLHRLLAYGLIATEKDGLPVFCYANKFGITKKGSDAMEYWKQVRYTHTDKKRYLTKEGAAMITLPGERYNNDGYTIQSPRGN
jgi:hypothetical protein